MFGVFQGARLRVHHCRKVTCMHVKSKQDHKRLEPKRMGDLKAPHGKAKSKVKQSRREDTLERMINTRG